MSPDDALRVLTPAAAGAAAGAVVSWLLRGSRLDWGALGAPVGLAAAVVLLRGFPGFPPTNVTDWPVFLAVPAAVAGLLATASLRVCAPLAVVAVAVALPTALTVQLRQWSVQDAALWLSVCAVAWLALIGGTRAAAQVVGNAILPAWGATLAVAAVVAVVGHSASLGLFLGGAAMAAGVLAVARLVWGQGLSAAGPAVSLAVLGPVWWLLTYTLADVPLHALACLAVAPMAAWVAWPWRERAVVAGVMAAVVAALVAGVAVWITRAAG